ncbi:hypothetical protein EEB15_26730 [Ramlibacter sp. WS9]|nr:hypothetical protein EEB15_26730 [Ramlibacter sp. WS9]
MNAPESVQARAPDVEPFVVTLDPLSNAEAHRCAAAFSLQESGRFWTAVGDGEYEYMATRPLDLRWMVGLWNQRRTLGTYLQLIEVNIAQRLQEFNESYESAGEALSVVELHSGATELAAAAEFGGAPFFALDRGAEATSVELVPYAILNEWKPVAVRRLLATAIFDEASYGRVMFHHRSVREYLAAEWVAEQLALGVPLLRMQSLFAGRPFGQNALIPGRRAALAWLAAMNAEVREWVSRDFPEVLLHDGDPQSWDQLSADKAFKNWVTASTQGFRVDWTRSPSQYLRVGRSLGVGQVAEVLSNATVPSHVRSVCFRIARHAKLTDCAEIAFSILRSQSSLLWERRSALELLQSVGTPEHGAEILEDLKSGALATNDLVAHALPVVDWRQLTANELAAIFASTGDEEDTGMGPMAELVKGQLLPIADLAATTLLLTAVMAALPRPVAGKRFARFPESDRPERAWLLRSLPGCFEQMLHLLPSSLTSYDEVCMEAAERVEALRDTGFTNRTELERLHLAVAKHSALRWKVALAIAQSEDIRASVSRLTWRDSSLASFEFNDLPELVQRANDAILGAHERGVWFSVAVRVIFGTMHRRERSSALRVLLLDGVDGERRRAIGDEYLKACQGARSRRVWEASERRRIAEADRDNAGFKARVAEHLPDIRDGTHFGWLRALLQYAFDRFHQREYSEVNFDAMGDALSPEIAAAFRAGLRAHWTTLVPPNPSDYPDNQVPWTAIVALAGVHLALQDESAMAALPTEWVAKAAQLSVWELNAPPAWLAPLSRAHPADVIKALSPWVVAEAQEDGDHLRRSLETALRCPPEIRRGLLAPLAQLVSSGQIPRRETLEALVMAVREDGLLQSADVATLCQSKLMASIASDGRISEMKWLRIWMEENSTSAFAWFVAHLAALNLDNESELGAFAAAIADLKWVSAPLTQAAADVLIRLHAMVSVLPSVRAATAERDDFFGSPQKRLRGAIPNVFVAAPGSIGHESLLALLPAYTDAEDIGWIRGRVIEHGALEVAATANRNAAELKSLSSAFSTAPRTEAQLFEQVIARLEEIRKSIQEGPFSERDLFRPGMPEKHLQRWLAAKFLETQNRRFSVHREEEVDDDKITDIQLSCSAGNVCVEIKPVDVTRSYSANSLSDTLQTQIVGQYLRGYNSSRGILVLLQLDDKRWHIPAGASGQPFPALVTYLDHKAKSIKRISTGVNELVVFGISCIVD